MNRVSLQDQQSRDENNLKELFAHVVVLLPHFDDEVFVLLPLLNSRSSSSTIKFIFLTRDESHRKNESLCFLKDYGFSSDQIIFLGDELNLPDGHLVQHLSTAKDRLQQIFSHLKPSLVLAPDWEGGHQDHDASYLLSMILSKEWECPSYHYMTYTGNNCHGYFYRVLHSNPSRSRALISNSKYSFFDVVQLLWRIRYYKSQWKTWLGLLPFLALNLILKRKVDLVHGSMSICQNPPHEGPLLYERYKRMTYQQFKTYAVEFYTKS